MGGQKKTENSFNKPDVYDGRIGAYEVGINELNNSQINDFLARYTKENRPGPQTYLSKKYIKNHLDRFEKGMAKFRSCSTTGAIGPESGTFVLPLNLARYLIKTTKGNPAKLEKLLGLNSGELGERPVLIVISNQRGLRIPSGQEWGAIKDYWLPGGYTKGGLPEAVIDQVLPGEYTIESIVK